MSMPKISDINPNISISRDDAVNVMIASIAMEELSLAHILNAEGEKLQYVLGTLNDNDLDEIKICDILAVNKSIQRTLRDVIKAEMLLQFKMEDAITLTYNGSNKCRRSVTAKVIWRDGNNMTGIRPEYVEIDLMRDGEVFKTAIIDTADSNTHTFACLLPRENSEHDYVFRVDLAEIPDGYTKTVEGNNIILTIKPGSITVAGSKIWDDNNNARGLRLASITVKLLQNGAPNDTKTVTSPLVDADKVDFSFTDKPQFDSAGNPYVYTVDEETVANYTKSITGFTIKNTIIPTP